jgi:predicted metalloprotease with PDZ domain
MYRLLTALFCISFSFYTFSFKVDYSLRMPKPQNHYFEVEMKIDDLSGKNIDVKMPTWAPGSYMIREFSKNVNLVKAYNEDGEKLSVNKVNKNTWRIERSKAKSIVVKYEVYAFELSVRSSFLDLSHGFVSGSSIFMYVDSAKNSDGKLDIYPYEDFNVITTSLSRPKDSIRFENAQTYYFKDFDQLVDSPIEIGNQEVFEFVASGVKHTVAMYGVGNYSIPKLQKDMKNVVETATNVFRENPNKKYTFIIHNVLHSQGGLEHENSTTLSVNRWGYEGDDYLNFLSLVAHEYFHLWNVKRIRPIELGPFNYDQENYTSLLWVMEGFTSYYDELLMRRAGYYSEDQYLQKLTSILNYVEGSEGTKVQPVAHASFDAWIKAYRPNENSSNTTMTYYSRGQLLAALLDVKIIAKFGGTKCLDDFMRLLYVKYYKKEGRGFTEKEFEHTLSDFLKEDMSEFFKQHVYGVESPDYKKYFEAVGLKVEYIGKKNASFGVSFSKDTNPVVKSVRVNSAAEDSGLSVNDEVIGFNGFRINGSNLEGSINGLKSGDRFNLLVSRDDILIDLPCVMGEYEKPMYKIGINNTSMNFELLNYWLRKLD